MNNRSLANLLRLYSQAGLASSSRDDENQDVESDDHNYSSEGEEEEERKQPGSSRQLAVSRIVRSIYMQRQLQRISSGASNQAASEDQQSEGDSEDERDRQASNKEERAIHLDSRYPEQWREIEDAQSEVAQEIYGQMGTLAALIYVRINQSKILQSLQISGGPLNFLKPVLEYYGNLLSKKEKDPFDKYNSEKISQILSFLPPLNELKQALKLRDPKENLVYKIVLDVRGQNLREQASAKQTKIFTKHYLPLALEFYESLNEEQYTQIQALILKLTSGNIQEKLLTFKSREEQVQHLQLELIRCSNIYSGNSPKKYIL